MEIYTHSNPISLRSHKKSRTGCRACKARKVKCDEKRPVCGKCTTHFSNIKSCDYGAESKPTGNTSDKISLPLKNKVLLPRKAIPAVSSLKAGMNQCQEVDGILSVAESTSSVRALMYHWINTLALFPTQIHSQYCTNPTWLLSAISNPALFNVTLFACAIHEASLKGERKSSQTLFYGAQTIRALNSALGDPVQAVADETISAVLLLTHIVEFLRRQRITGDSAELEVHSKGLQKLISLRGGIDNLTLDGVLLHMLCTTNHLTAVFSECQNLKTTSEDLCNQTRHSATPDYPGYEPSPIASFALSCGFHSTVVELLYGMGYLYAVVDAFTTQLLPGHRPAFEDLMRSTGKMGYIDCHD